MDKETTFLQELKKWLERNRPTSTVAEHLTEICNFFHKLSQQEDPTQYLNSLNNKFAHRERLSPSESFIYLFVSASAAQPHLVLEKKHRPLFKDLINVLLSCAQNSSDLEFAAALEGIRELLE